MAREKTFSDEVLLEALLAEGTIPRAAALVGCAQSTIRERMTHKEFVQRYRDLRRESLRDAAHVLADSARTAAQTFVDVATDTSAPAAVRLQAAQAILSHLLKIYDAVDVGDYQSAKSQNLFYEL